jgi:tetratricopeptide (TPR) repeat protein
MADQMDVFISWSGARSKALAIHLHEWLKAVVQRANPWMSERDIDAGQRWNEQISLRLKETHFGIICLTPENLNAPWLLFEAGALAKALDAARVVPVLLDIRKANLTFPLAQFQSVEADRDGFFGLVSAMNRALGDQQLPSTLLVNIFGGLWGTLEAALLSLPPKERSASQAPQRSDRELLEDVLDGVRSVQRTIGVNATDGGMSDSVDWEDYYIRGVNLANTRGGHETDLAGLRAYNEAIALAPPTTDENIRSRLHAYRGALLKRLRRLDEAMADLLLARQWAHDDREVEDALYNLAGVAALAGNKADAIAHLRELIARSPHWVGVIAAKKDYFANLQREPDFKAIMMSQRHSL